MYIVYSVLYLVLACLCCLLARVAGVWVCLLLSPLLALPPPPADLGIGVDRYTSSRCVDN